MKLQIKKLTLCNFKGIKSQTINLDGQNALIYGANATGKTTIMDAFIWLLFGKNSSDAKDFNIKPILMDARMQHSEDHYVEAILLTDNMEQTLKRTYREKWVRKRGMLEPEFSGHETIYEINGVPTKAGDYSKFVDDMINEDIFKVITNPLYFNDRIKWQNRRELLISLAGNIDTSKLEENHKEIIKEMNSLGSSEFKLKIASLKKKAKEEKAQCQPRISEQKISLPEEMNWKDIEQEIENLLSEIKDIDLTLQKSTSISQDVLDKQQKLMTRKSDNEYKIHQIKMNLKASSDDQHRKRQNDINAVEYEISSLENKIRSINNTKQSYYRQIEDIDTNITLLKTKIDSCRSDWQSINERTFIFDETMSICPVCKQSLPTQDVEERRSHLEQNFIEEKIKILKEKVETANKLKKLIAEETERKIALEEQKNNIGDVHILEKEIEEKKTLLSNLNNAKIVIPDINNNQEIQSLLKENESIDVELNKPFDLQEKSSLNTVDLNASKVNKQEQIREKHNLLCNRELREKGLKRIEEISNREKELAQEIARLEGLEFAAMEYTKDSILNIENAINNKFKIVRFKMFDTQLNGGEVECCETTINGVPWNDLNTASKINAGIDIVNAFSDYYDSYAPVFIDNRESVTELTPIMSQSISLIVSPECKSLKIQTI